MKTQPRKSNQYEAESFERLLLLAFVVVVTAGFMWTTDSSIHTVWAQVISQVNAALTQVHIS